MPDIARVCHKCKVYIMVRPDDLGNQQAMQQFEKDHARHAIGSLDIAEVRDSYTRIGD